MDISFQPKTRTTELRICLWRPARTSHHVWTTPEGWAFSPAEITVPALYSSRISRSGHTEQLTPCPSSKHLAGAMNALAVDHVRVCARGMNGYIASLKKHGVRVDFLLFIKARPEFHP